MGAPRCALKLEAFVGPRTDPHNQRLASFASLAWHDAWQLPSLLKRPQQSCLHVDTCSVSGIQVLENGHTLILGWSNKVKCALHATIMSLRNPTWGLCHIGAHT